MEYLPFFLVLCLCVGAKSQLPEIGNITTTRFEWEDCKLGDNDLGVINRMWIDPDPFVIPASDIVSLNFDVTFHQDLTEPLDMRLDFLKKIPLLFGMVSWLRVPCIETNVFTFGSCFFKDLCHDKTYNFKNCVREDTREVYECGCPTFKKGRYIIKPFEYELPQMPDGIPQYILDGEMFAELTLLSGGKNVSCYKTMVYTKTAYPEENDYY